jgi:hypothetical protein
MSFRTALAGVLTALLLTLGLAAVPATAATTRTVCASGCDHTTIAAAVAAASAGDTILVTEDLSVGAATSVNKDVTITGADGVTVTRTGTSAATLNLTSAADGATISNLTITSATVVGGAFLNVAAGANDVTIAGNTIFGPPQAGPMSGWTTNRAWVSGAVSGLTVTGNTFHSLRTGGYIDNGSGTITGNVSYDTKGDYLLSGQSDFTFSGNVAGDATHKSEWGIVIFAVNETPYDVQALGAANDCLSVWDQATDETFVDGDCNGINDTAPPTDKDACKQGGWATFDNPSFKNQGQCVSSVAAHKA